MYTIFQRTEIQEPALFNPTDTTKKIKDFPDICVSTFSDNIILNVGLLCERTGIPCHHDWLPLNMFHGSGCVCSQR